MNGMTIAKRLREFRAIKRLTSSEVANKLGIPVRTLGSYERGEVLPGSKFYNLMIENYDININWLISGRGSMFISQNVVQNKDSISQLQEEIKLSNDDLKMLIDILKSDASRNMILKFIDIKRGNKDALNTLIANLQGIKAVF